MSCSSLIEYKKHAQAFFGCAKKGLFALTKLLVLVILVVLGVFFYKNHQSQSPLMVATTPSAPSRVFLKVAVSKSNPDWLSKLNQSFESQYHITPLVVKAHDNPDVLMLDTPNNTTPEGDCQVYARNHQQSQWVCLKNNHEQSQKWQSYLYTSDAQDLINHQSFDQTSSQAPKSDPVLDKIP